LPSLGELAQVRFRDADLQRAQRVDLARHVDLAGPCVELPLRQRAPQEQSLEVDPEAPVPAGRGVEVVGELLRVGGDRGELGLQLQQIGAPDAGRTGRHDTGRHDSGPHNTGRHDTGRHRARLRYRVGRRARRGQGQHEAPGRHRRTAEQSSHPDDLDATGACLDRSAL